MVTRKISRRMAPARRGRNPPVGQLGEPLLEDPYPLAQHAHEPQAHLGVAADHPLEGPQGHQAHQGRHRGPHAQPPRPLGEADHPLPGPPARRPWRAPAAPGSSRSKTSTDASRRSSSLRRSHSVIRGYVGAVARSPNRARPSYSRPRRSRSSTSHLAVRSMIPRSRSLSQGSGSWLTQHKVPYSRPSESTSATAQ